MLRLWLDTALDRLSMVQVCINSKKLFFQESDFEIQYVFNRLKTQNGLGVNTIFGI